MRPIKWTPEEIAWLSENYPIKSDHDCRIHLHISYEKLYQKVDELGLVKIKKRRVEEVNKTPNKKKVLWIDDGHKNRFCMECKTYLNGGICTRTGKPVGALWQKKCFRGEG